MPLVLLLNLSGKIMLNSGNIELLSRSECSWATPFVLCVPMMARFAMRTILGFDSSMIETLASFSFWSGK